MRPRGLRPAALASAAWLSLLAAGAAMGGDSLRLLPERAEVIDRGRARGETLVDVRGRDCTALSFLKTLATIDSITVDVDPGAADLLRRTILTIDLRERPANDVVALLCATVGVDTEARPGGFRVIAAPAPGSGAPREALSRTCERFYEIALTRQDDVTLAARSMRGLADLYRANGEWLSAYSLYETLLSAAFRDSPSSKDCELLLADCYVGIGQIDRAGRLLKSFVDRSADREATERAFRRLIGVLVEQRRFEEIQDLRGPVAALGALQPDTSARIADAVAAMLEQGAARSAAAFLGEVWAAAPVENAALGPVLALSLSMIEGAKGASEVLERCTPHLGATIPASAFWALAEMAARQEKAPETLVYARRALMCDGVSPQIARRSHMLLATLYEQACLAERARYHLYEAELLSSPEDAAVLALRSAELTLTQGEPEHARLLFVAAGEYEAKRHEAAYGVARALRGAGDPTRALDRVRELLREELDPELSDDVRVFASDCFADLKDYERALAVLDGDVSVFEEKEEVDG